MNGEILWTEAQKRKLLPWREPIGEVRSPVGEPKVDLKKVAARLQEVRNLHKSLPIPGLNWPAERLQRLEQRVHGPAAASGPLEVDIEAAYLCLLGHNDMAWDRCHEIGADMVHWWVAQAGPAFALQALVDNYGYAPGCVPTDKPQRGYFPYLGPWRALRSYLATAAEPEYERALALAQSARGGAALSLRRMLALAFPGLEDLTREVAQEALAGQPAPQDFGLLASLRDGELFRALLERLHPYMGNDFVSVKLLDYAPTGMARMGWAALPGIRLLAEKAAKSADRRATAQLLSQYQSAEVRDWFAARQKDKVIGPIALAYLDTPPAVQVSPSPAGGVLPELLSFPPWERPRPQKKPPPKRQLAMAPYEERLHMPPEVVAELLRRNEICTPEQFQRWTEHFPEDSPYLTFAEHLCDLCDREWALRAWNETPFQRWNIYSFRSSWDRTPERLLATFGPAALPGLLAIAPAAPDLTYAALAQVESPRLAVTFAELRQGKKFRALAQRWLKDYPKAASLGLIPAAMEGHRAAIETLRWMAGQNQGETILEAARAYEVQPALQELLDYDPLLELPARMPVLPVWWRPDKVSGPRLRNGEELPATARTTVAMMLAISRLDAPYAGLEQLREFCDEHSLQEFAWSVYQLWLAAGGPAKEDWGFLVLAYFGGDQAARKLGPEIRRWPGEGHSSRAALGLEVLGAIATDVALMHLYGISQKVRFKALQDKAQAKIASIAEERGLSVEELADRLVPDLDLEADGSRQIGPYRVCFDEHLVPSLQDAQGKALKDFPAARDESARAQADAWKALKKDAKTIAATQIERLEQALARRRRWPAATFELLLVFHPLLGHLARRLIWGCYQSGQEVVAFRVAEDRTYADVHDNPWKLPAEAEVGLIHPLETDLSGWAGILKDYEILQPFAQVGRATFVGEPQRFQGRCARPGAILRLEKRGWHRGEVESGCLLDYQRQLPSGRVVLQLEESPALEELARIEVTLGPLELPADCDPIDLSEALADLEGVLR